MKIVIRGMFVFCSLTTLCAQDFNVSRQVGTDVAQALFNEVDGVIKKLSLEKRQMIEKIKREQEQAVRLLADPAKKAEISEFFKEAAALEVQDEQSIARLLEKYPVMKSMQGGGLFSDFLFGIAQVLVDRGGMAEEEALVMAQKLAVILLNIPG